MAAFETRQKHLIYYLSMSKGTQFYSSRINLEPQWILFNVFLYIFDITKLKMAYMVSYWVMDILQCD